MYTSGTTGRPKGAMLTHGNLWWNNTNALHTLDVSEDDVTLVVAPLFHIGGLNVTTLITWQKGGEIVLHRSFDPGRFLEDIAARTASPPRSRCPPCSCSSASTPTSPPPTSPSLRLVICGGAPVPEPLHEAVQRARRPHQPGLRPDRDRADGDVPHRRVRPRQARLGRQDAAVHRGAHRRRRRAPSSPSRCAKGEVCVSGPNVHEGLLEQARRHRGRRSTPRAGSTPATSATSTTTASCSSPTGSRTWSSPAARTSTRPRSRACSTTTPPSPRSPSSASPTSAGARPSWRSSALKPERARRSTSCATSPDDRLARYKLPTRLEIVDALPRNPAGKVLKFELREQFGS